MWPRWAGTSHKVLSIPTTALDGAGPGCVLPTQTSVSTKIFQEGMAVLAEAHAFLLESLLHCSHILTSSSQGLGLWGPLPHLPDKGLPTGGHAAQILCPFQRPELLGNPGSDAACYCLRAHPAQRAECCLSLKHFLLHGTVLVLHIHPPPWGSTCLQPKHHMLLLRTWSMCTCVLTQPTGKVIFKVSSESSLCVTSKCLLEC